MVRGVSSVRRGVAFETERLHVASWHRPVARDHRPLTAIVRAMLTPTVTHPLPDAWHGRYDEERAQRWIAGRDKESEMLLCRLGQSDETVGLLILSWMESDVLRIGYLLQVSAFGHGYASEMVVGLVEWCRTHSTNAIIEAGVASDNVASIRVLTRSGFTAVLPHGNAEQTYVLRLAD